MNDKLEVDGTLTVTPPLFINAPFQASQSCTKGEKLKQGCDVTGDRTRDLAHAPKAAHYPTETPCS